MRVIADLYGAGDPHNKHAKREFREIKEAVMADVSCIRNRAEAMMARPLIPPNQPV